MSELTVNGSGDLPPSASARIGEACERFVSAWQAGQRPRIEEALEVGPTSLSRELLRSLLVLELSCRRRNGESLTPGEYRTRFPEHAQLIDSLFRELILSTGAGKSWAAALPLKPRYRSKTCALMGYVILGELGHGGMGIVYQAYDCKRDQRVALKTIQRPDPASLLRFKQEFRTLADVAHPNLVALYELISDGSVWFFTMELVDGVDFLTYIRLPVIPGDATTETDHDLSYARRTAAPSRQLTDTEVDPDPHHAASGSRTTDPVQVPCPPGNQAWRCPVRPLRGQPSGSLPRGLRPCTRLASSTATSSPPTCSSTGKAVSSCSTSALPPSSNRPDLHESSEPHVVGTVAYMAPEQAASLPVSPASDWYSVGVMLYQALTGRLPFLGRPWMYWWISSGSSRRPARARGRHPGRPQFVLRRAATTGSRSTTGGCEVLRRLGSEPDAAALPLLIEILADSGCSAHRPASGISRSWTPRSQAEPGADGRRLRPRPLGGGQDCLVQHFLSSLAGRKAAVVLAGRCYEQESVPYKALDSLVDCPEPVSEATVHRTSAGDAARATSAAGAGFPGAAAGSRPWRRRRGVRSRSPTPEELRRRAFAALRELLARLGDRRPAGPRHRRPSVGRCR